MTVAIIHKEKFKNLLFLWIGWTFSAVVIILVALFIGVAQARSNFIDIAVVVIFSIYQLCCMWLVFSYYKLLSDLPEGRGDENDAMKFGAV